VLGEASHASVAFNAVTAARFRSRVPRINLKGRGKWRLIRIGRTCRIIIRIGRTCRIFVRDKNPEAPGYDTADAHDGREPVPSLHMLQ
jgi:hypothetical protein